MKLKILCPQWGHEQLDTEDFFIKVKEAGYDGVDTWMPESKLERKRFLRLLKDYGLSLVCQQHQASGNSVDEFCKSYEYYLNLSMECDPILINSHSGRDYFSQAEQLQVIDIAENFSLCNNIVIAHETHRGRICFSPANTYGLLKLRPHMKITADLSHWVCVTESYLENFQEEISEAILRSAHIHARVGFTEGPQIPDPRKPYWRESVHFFLKIWERILNYQRLIGARSFTITPEFGPPPYMWVDADDKPFTSQWDINIYMKHLLIESFSGCTS